MNQNPSVVRPSKRNLYLYQCNQISCCMYLTKYVWSIFRSKSKVLQVLVCIYELAIILLVSVPNFPYLMLIKIKKILAYKKPKSEIGYTRNVQKSNLSSSKMSKSIIRTIYKGQKLTCFNFFHLKNWPKLKSLKGQFRIGWLFYNARLKTLLWDQWTT